MRQQGDTTYSCTACREIHSGNLEMLLDNVRNIANGNILK